VDSTGRPLAFRSAPGLQLHNSSPAQQGLKTRVPQWPKNPASPGSVSNSSPRELRSPRRRGDPRLVTSRAGDLEGHKMSRRSRRTQTDQSTTPLSSRRPPKTSPSARSTQDLVDHLRDETIPTPPRDGMKAPYVALNRLLHRPSPSRSATALPGDSHRGPPHILFLTMAFLTLVVPLVSALITLLALAAAYGGSHRRLREGLRPVR